MSYFGHGAEDRPNSESPYRCQTSTDGFAKGAIPIGAGALQSAVDYFAARDKRNRLVRELNKLDRAEESRLSEEGLGDESWPTYREERFTGPT